MKTIRIDIEEKKENNSLTIAELALQVEEQAKENLSTGGFTTFTDFLTYYERHYLPVLRDIRDGKEIDGERRRKLNFLADDIIQMMHVNKD